TQIHTRLTRSFAQYGYRGDVQTTVLSDNDRLCLCNLCSDFFDNYRFLLTIETHGLNTPSKDAWEGPLRQPNAAHLVEFFNNKNSSMGAVYAGPSLLRLELSSGANVRIRVATGLQRSLTAMSGEPRHSPKFFFSLRRLNRQGSYFYARTAAHRGRNSQLAHVHTF